MPDFLATVLTPTGARLTLQRTATTAAEASAALRAEGHLLLSLTEAAPASAPHAPPPWHPAWLRPVRPFDIEIGLQQLSLMLKSGVSLLPALETVAEQSLSPRAARTWRRIRDAVSSGTSLSAAIAAHGRRFGAATIELVRVGEQTGELDTALLHAARQLESQRNLKTLLLNALAYPFFAVLLALAVSVFLVVGVIPKIAEFLETGGAALPASTQFLLDLSAALRARGPVILLALAALTALYLLLRALPAGRRALDTLSLRLPVTGRIRRLAGTAVFARAMGMLVQSGVTLLVSLDTARALLTNTRLADRVQSAREAVLRGGALAPALRPRHDLMPMLAQMVAVGETTGSLADAFTEVARFHEMMLAVAIKRFGAAIEPLLILLTGGLVGYVYIAFFMALFSISSMT
jgi:type IV pilus assembly protein PilC